MRLRPPLNHGCLLSRCSVPENGELRPGVFLDRDGTIAEEVGYLNHASRFHMFPFVPAAIRKLNDRGLLVFLVTNQSGVGRGYFPESLVRTVHDLIKEQINAEGAHIDGFYYCPHVSADACACRKPGTGMLKQAAEAHRIDLNRSFVVGDRLADIELGHRAGARKILVRTGYGEGELQWHAPKWTVQPDFIAVDLRDAADWILEQIK
jgi:D-glycero-D-manno-heptose 1,7-bisphosphate phosphatase